MGKRPLTTLPTDRVLIAPSILAADFSRLGDEIRRADAGGADVLHVDIMDGHFVPNLSLGPPVVAGIRGTTALPFDVHLMITDPARYAAPFATAGADHITIHVEIEGDVAAVLRQIRGLGCSTGLSLRPGTPAARLVPYLGEVDLVLVMAVEPGFGGQSFRADMLPKIREVRRLIDAGGRPIHLEVDGGINAATGRQAIEAGGQMLVAGTSLFRAHEGMAKAVAQLRGAASAA